MKITTDTPMMSNKEINIIHGLLEKHKPELCLEWGSGNSTIYFSKRPFIKLWVAIEHNGSILDELQKKLPKNVQTIWITNEQDYADCVQRTHQKFDFIFIDGLNRQKCLENARKIVSKNGIILLHDAGRPEYAEFIEANDGKMLCQGEIAVPGGYAHRGLALFKGVVNGTP